MKRAMVIGAGSAGRLTIEYILTDPDMSLKLVGIVDDDREKLGIEICGVKVLGVLEELKKLVEETKAELIIIAVPSMDIKRKKEIMDQFEKGVIEFLQMPVLEKILLEGLEQKKPHKVDVAKLLDREEVYLDRRLVESKLSGQTVLVTGAGGSIGSEIVRQICKCSPAKVILVGHGENSIYQLLQELLKQEGTIEFIPVIASICDRDNMFSLMKKYRPTIVYHAAAHKHVPLMEQNVNEAVYNNIYGTLNVAEAAKANDVSVFVMVSTDKAVYPTNVMGATKRIAEMLVTLLDEEGHTHFSVVRFGNVLGSRGSVIPLFRKQIQQGGPVTVTDYRMTRYFMTIPEASCLVIQASALSKGGEIFILDMGEPVKILHLAKRMIKLSGYTEVEIPIKESGIRPGEKLYEELLVSKEQIGKKLDEKIFVGKVCGFNREEIFQFLTEWEKAPAYEKREKLIAFANDSSK